MRTELFSTLQLSGAGQCPTPTTTGRNTTCFPLQDLEQGVPSLTSAHSSLNTHWDLAEPLGTLRWPAHWCPLPPWATPTGGGACSSTHLNWLLLTPKLHSSHPWPRAMLSPMALLPGYSGDLGFWKNFGPKVKTKGKVPNLLVVRFSLCSTGEWMQAFLSGLLKYQQWVPQMCL